MAQLEIGAPPPDLHATSRPRLQRSRTNRVIAGVAAGVGNHLGFEPAAVRLAFSVLALAAGFGVIVYLLLWLLAPAEPAGTATGPPSARPWRPSPRHALGTGLVLAGVLILLWLTGTWFGWQLGWPVSLAAIGFAILWARTAGDEGRARLDLRSVSSPLQAVLRGDAPLPRVAAGSLLIVAGMAVFLAATTSLAAAANVVLAVLVTAGGLALLVGPWFWRLAGDLMEERNSRIRSEARAEVAAHLHDSVLQTLALIQRSQEPREMAALARTQERELRAWLYGRAPSHRGTTLRDAVDELAGRIERDHHVRVETVVVGDLELDQRLRALVGALGEATLNAAKHAGRDEVSVYVEVEDAAVTAFVRDEGVGFDASTVPGDRGGIAESIVGRLARHGGTADIRSEPGRGTEVSLRLPRSLG